MEGTMKWTFVFLVTNAVYIVCGTENLALNQPAMASQNGAGGEASRGNDGGYNPDFYQGSCTFTVKASTGLPYAWWIVDLGDVYRISHVVVARRTTHFLMNDLHFEMYMGVPLICRNQPAVCNYVGAEFSFPLHNVTCKDDTAVGRYLMIRNSDNSNAEIALCEAEVYGELVTLPVQPTSNCSGPMWVNRRADHGLSGEAITGNATSPVACARDCYSVGQCSAFSFNSVLGKCEYAAGFVKAFVAAEADWLSYDFC